MSRPGWRGIALRLASGWNGVGQARPVCSRAATNHKPRGDQGRAAPAQGRSCPPARMLTGKPEARDCCHRPRPDAQRALLDSRILGCVTSCKRRVGEFCSRPASPRAAVEPSQSRGPTKQQRRAAGLGPRRGARLHVATHPPSKAVPLIAGAGCSRRGDAIGIAVSAQQVTWNRPITLPSASFQGAITAGVGRSTTSQRLRSR